MNNSNPLYTNFSQLCHSFYRMYFPHNKIAHIIDSHLKKYNCKSIVFFGGLIHVAKILREKGYKITFVDYTKEMLTEAKKTLNNTDFIISDMRSLNLDEKQDAIILMGRIFTYLHTDKDVQKTLTAFKNNLNPGGIILIDNYETGKIDTGNYFNGIIELKENNHILRRISSIVQKEEHPALYNWSCIYEDIHNTTRKTCTDKNHILRAFTKEEIKKQIEHSGLKFIENTPNFEKISFITIAQKIDIKPKPNI
ncbi:MAG: class I SAM-dependent methyltransferase [archaeon]|nr:class I SAM-dependent methyltransferase [archaeon]